MKKNGVIQGCSITLDLQKLGYQGSVHILIKTQGKTAPLVEKLRSIKDIIICTSTFGEYQVYAVLVFKVIEELYDTILQIKIHPEVSAIDFSFAVPGMRFYPPNDALFARLKENNKETK